MRNKKKDQQAGCGQFYIHHFTSGEFKGKTE